MRQLYGTDEFWHWEYHGTAALCHMKNYPTTYGHNTIVSGGLDNSVTNPRLPDGKPDVYVGCDEDKIQTADGIDADT